MENYSLSGKKGNAIVEGLTILIVCVIFAIGGVFANMIFDDLNSGIQSDDEMGTVAKETTGNLYSKFPTLIDNLFLFLFSMFVVFVMVSVFMVDTHPIFFIIAIILLISVFIAAIFIGNAYNELASDPEVAPYANAMPYMSFVMRHIVEMIIAVGFITSILLFVKMKNG